MRMQPIGTTTVTAVAATDKHHFIGFDGSICGEGEKALGTSQVSVDAGEPMPVTFSGIMPIVAAGAISSGSEVESNANGEAVPMTTGASNGYAMDTAVQAGDTIRILLKV